MEVGRDWYIGRSVNSEPSDQTDLNKRCRCNLGGGGGTDVEAEADMWDQGIDRPAGGVGWPYLSSPQGLPQGNAFWWPLEPSGVVFAADKRNFI
jgi:hypothetical protein